jgi:hypothetical protein
LFFVTACAVTAEVEPPPQLEELRLVIEQLRVENQQLKSGLEQREKVIRLLTENLAIARTESALFQKQWTEAQLRARTLGVDFADPESSRAQHELIESIRALYLAEADRQRLIDQLSRLVAALDNGGDPSAELASAKALLEASQGPSQPPATRKTEPTLESAKILDVNPNLRLVVLNVGLLHGARVGMPFVVVRGDRVVAHLKVVEVRKQICGALIETIDKAVTLAAGDVAQVTKS